MEYHDERGNLIISESKIELSLVAGQTYSGSFELSEENGFSMEGQIYSSSIRMSLNVDSIHGKKCFVTYEFDSQGMQPGDVIKGSFMIVSNVGEYLLPYTVTISRELLTSSMGNIKNLFHFTNLAKTDWDEAVRIFSMPTFINLLSAGDSSYRNLYLGLSGSGNRNYNLEEFLVGINKKQVIEFYPEKNDFRIVDSDSNSSNYINIIRNGWGYTLLAVKSEGSFIELSTNRITSADFEENVCRFEFKINENKLHRGKNLGRIYFKYLYGSFEVNLVLVKTSLARTNPATKRKNEEFSLVRYYLDYLNSNLSQNKWVKLSEDILNHRLSLGIDALENNMHRTHLLLLQERYNEAKWLLDRRISDGIEDASNELYSYYLYLLSIYNVDERYTRDAYDKIRSIYEKDPDNWRVAWILMHVSNEFKKNPSRMYAFGVRQLSRGCYSPIIYAELIKLLNSIPNLLVHFDDEEIRLLYYGAKNKLIGSALQGQIAYHALRKREYDEKTFKLLVYMYEARNDDDTLAAICSQLLKGDKVSEKYFKWYELGVSKNLAITKLYESYMLSMNLLNEAPIPREVLMYFSYKSNLPVLHNSYLYAYVIKNKDQMPEIYALYRNEIERFIVKQLYAGKINRDLAYLYQEVLMKTMATADNIRQFSRLFLVHCIRISDPSIVNVIVIDERLKREMVHSVSSSVANVSLPSNDYTILLEDAYGHRYFRTKEYITERYFLPKKMLPLVEKYTEDSVLFDLFICEGNKDYITVNDRNLGRYVFLEKSEDINDDFRSAIRMPLIRYYQDKEDNIKLDEMLEDIEVYDVPAKSRDELLRLMLVRGFLDKAYRLILSYGAETIDPKILARVATLKLERDGMFEDKYTSAIICSAFERGKYNESLLNYLVSYYKGLAKNLRNIWKAASDFYVDTYSICEKMIAQTLFSGAYIGEEVEILKEYVEGGAKTELELRFLEKNASDYFEDDRVIDEYLMKEMARIYDNEGELPLICMLAYLKFYSVSENRGLIDSSVRSHLQRFIGIVYSKYNIFLPCMKEYKGICKEASEMANYSILEYHGDRDSKVIINYIKSNEKNNKYGYVREEMTKVFGGVYVKAFLLFFGESIQYYITEEKDDNEQLQTSGTIAKNDADNDTVMDKYAMVNDISIATALKDYDTALELLEEYKFREYLTDNLFKRM